ncbi:hypothetical protein PENSTE_c005G10451 [Penicillium steckii]|uniref:Uncharacterized protein n=1 Tax=Penicillium steckii TaxID=303698 RepID=A0A1V6TKB3_9EURO|nr:hypothetical protein PENSTE_c005G10451 [Penicillium steckii]
MPLIEEKGFYKEQEASQAQSNAALITRNLCSVGLASGWLLSLLCIVGGSVMLAQNCIAPDGVQGKAFLISFSQWNFKPPEASNLPGHRIVPMQASVSILLNLMLNILVTAILDTTNYIHDTTLKWALYHEGRLKYNSNIRLFTSSRCHGPNAWYANAVSLLGLALTHGSLSIVIVNMVVIGVWNDKSEAFEFTFNHTNDFVEINCFALVSLGIGVFLQALVSTCSLLCSRGVKTWNSSLLANAKAIARQEKGSGEDYTILKVPNREIQSSMLDIAPQIFLVRRLIWSFVGLFVAWSLGHGIYITTQGYDMDNVVGWSRNIQQYWQFYGGVWMGFTRIFKTPPYWLGILIQTVLQSFITFALHCVELLFKISRDEASWRSLQSTGSQIDTPILSNIQWQSFLMMGFKAVVQWVFGYAFTADETFNIALLPVIALMTLFMCLAISSEYMLRQRPRGTLPATYGDFERVLELVDEWKYRRMFWGDKGVFDDQTRLVGTAGRRLADLEPGMAYACLHK